MYPRKSFINRIYGSEYRVQSTWFVTLSGKTKEVQQNKISTIIQNCTLHFTIRMW